MMGIITFERPMPGIKNYYAGQEWRLMSIIPGTWEVEIRKISVLLARSHFNKQAGHGGSYLYSQVLRRLR
jgi:hypothetical protein